MLIAKRVMTEKMWWQFQIDLVTCSSVNVEGVFIGALSPIGNTRKISITMAIFQME